MTRVAVICPIGHLTRHGYQHVYRACIASMAAFAETVYLVSSTRDRDGIDELLAVHANIVYVSDERTWFELLPWGEHFKLELIGDNINLGLSMARLDGHGAAVVVESSQYIPEAAREPLLDACRDVVERGQAYDWLYRRDQLADTTFHANLRRPWIFNLAHAAGVKQPDGALFGGVAVRHERGSWPECDAAAVVDCPLEMSRADLREKLEYFQRPAANDWDYWRTYSVAKFKQKALDGAALDRCGQEIAAVSAAHPEFLSHEVLSML